MGASQATGLGSAEAPEPHTGLGPTGAIPSAAESYEARVYSAHLPNRIIAFIMPKGGVPFAGGIFRIERVRTVTTADEKAFPSPRDGICPLCGQVECEQ